MPPTVESVGSTRNMNPGLTTTATAEARNAVAKRSTQGLSSVVPRAGKPETRQGMNIELRTKHYLLHVMRQSPDFVRKLDFVAVTEGRIVGNVVYLKSHIEADDGNRYEVLSLGPLSVHPQYQRQGIGRMLIEHTGRLAAQMGFRAILLCGDSDYYSRVGFIRAEKFGIRTAENTYFDALHIRELTDESSEGLQGRYIENAIYGISAAEAAEYDKLFPPKRILVGTPSQKNSKKS